MKIKPVFAVLCLLLTTVHASDSEWRDRWMQEIDQIASTDIQNHIERLGIAVRAKSSSGAWQPTAAQLEVANRAIGILIEVPGHAEHYGKRIRKVHGDYKKEVIENNSAGLLHAYTNEIHYGFQTLRYLPSPETVRVLGEMLEDDWVDTTRSGLHQRGPSLAVLAMSSFVKLPLANKPISTRDLQNSEAELEIWRSWFAQIKAGKRTFRFEGDPTEYDLNGPASQEKLERIRQHRERDELRAANQQKSGHAVTEADARNEASERGFPVKGVLAAAALLLCAAGWYAFRLRNANRVKS